MLSPYVLQTEWDYFRMLYDNRDLPVQLVHHGPGKAPKSIRWFEDLRTMPDERFSNLLIKFSLGVPLLQQVSHY